MLKNKVIICYSGNNWTLPWGIAQKTMEKLSKYNKVFYIEYQPSFLHCYFRGLSHVKYNRRDRGTLKKVNNNLFLYKPKPGLPFNNYIRFINSLNHKRINEYIKSEITKYNPKKIILWAFVPYAIDFLNGLNRFFTIYHCAGDYSVEKNNFLRKRIILKMERELVKRSDLVIAQTKSMCSKFKFLNKKTFYLPSAINFDRFSKNESLGNIEFAKIKHPRIGIIGYFDDMFYDTSLLRYLLDMKRHWSFIFIGPVTGRAKNFSRLRKKPNAFFLGYKDPDQIPFYIGQLDIGIIPYKTNDYMREVSPTKFYEYVACGKPVVSTDLPDIKGYTDVLQTANNKIEFLKYIENFLSEEKREFLRDRALQIAEENSLDRYLENLSEVIENTDKRNQKLHE